MRTRCISALGAVLFAIIGLSACGGIPGNAVVQVGGSPITKITFAHWMSVAAASSVQATPGAPKPVIPDPPKYTACIARLQAVAPKPAKGEAAPTAAQLKSQCQAQYKAIQQQVLGFLISSQWVLGEASSLGVKISDKEVKKHFEQIKTAQFPKQGAFEKFLTASGQTVSDLLFRVKLNLVSTKIQEKITKTKVNITQAQIAKYYKENPSRFGLPESRSVELILTKTEAAAKSAKQEVKSGKSFASVAKRVSIDPTSKAKGGLIDVLKGEQEKALDAAIFSTQPKLLSGPVKTAFGYYIFEVKSIKPGTQQTLAQSQASIKQQLTATQQQAALAKFVKDFRKRWTAKTDCRAGYVVMDCKQYKAPKTTSTPTPVTPPTTTKK
jgi:foldase protein PrsA